jgi:trans-aconitate methyltransferase
MTDKYGNADQVRAMYERYPYPSPTVGDDLILDLANVVGFAFPEEEFDGKTIIDFGCGTGHRLIGVAQRYPRANVIGVDTTDKSLRVARELAKRHAVGNVQFVNEDLLRFRCPGGAELITATGVLHHLENPQAGFDSVANNLNESGIAVTWLYHAVGEYFRILDCELARILSRADDEYQDGIQVLQELRLALHKEQYGARTAHLRGEGSNLSVDVDAYLHPLVRAFRFEEAIEMFHHAGLSWACINGVNRTAQSKLLDPANVAEDPYFCLRPEELFQSPALVERFQKLALLEKLRAIEIAWRPTGFTCIGGRGDSYSRCDPRISSGVVKVE